MLGRFRSAGVEVRGCDRTRSFLDPEPIVSASDNDWQQEYSDLIISIKVVNNFDEAIAHIDRYGSRHTEAIITENRDTAERSSCQPLTRPVFTTMPLHDSPTVFVMVWERK